MFPLPPLAALFQRLEPVILCQQFASALFDTALQMMVKERCSNTTSGGGGNSTEEDAQDSRQKAVSNFYMTYNLLSKLAPILPSLLLARFGDRGWRKAPIIVPLTGYMLSRLMLLLVIVLDWPLEVMWAGATVHGLFGGFCAYWAGIMTLVSLGSSEQNRSRQMMRVELLYGVAGLVGSLVSGHVFHLYSASLGQGTILVSVSTFIHLSCLLYSIFLLQVSDKVSVSDKEREECRALISKSTAVCNGIGSALDRSTAINLALLFAGGILYDMAVGGGMEILVTFEMKEPLNWDATQMGYGNAAGFVVFLTSFMGVMVMSRWVSDSTLIIIGMLSFATGIYSMAFVTATYLFYLARSLTLFALIPMPTIRSLLSQQVHGSSYGITLTSLQLAFKLSSLAYTPAYTKIYQFTLSWFPGFVFTLSSIITVFATIPISVVGCMMPQRTGYERLQ